MSSEEHADAVFSGLRVFVAEDEFAVLLLIEDMLATLGCTIAASASTLAAAQQKVETCDVDVAVLDINLAGQRIYPVAAVFKRRQVPIVFCTGYGLPGIEPAWADYPIVQKPFAAAQLARGLAKAIAGQSPVAGILARGLVPN
jgi:CheY-like chemotaxis protein